MEFLKTRKERLKSKLNDLNNKLGNAVTDNDDDINIIVAKIKEAQQEIKNVELEAKIKAINEREYKRRKVMTELLKVCPIDPSIITNDGKLHKGKKGSNPELYSLLSKGYYRFEFESWGEIKLWLDGSYYYIGNWDNNTKELTPFESFEDACKCNKINISPLRLSDIKKRLTKLEKIEAKFKLELEKFEKAKKDIDVYGLSYEGFVNQQNIHAYTHYTNF